MSNLSSSEAVDNLAPKEDFTKTDQICPTCGHNESWRAKYKDSRWFRLCTRCSATYVIGVYVLAEGLRESG